MRAALKSEVAKTRQTSPAVNGRARPKLAAADAPATPSPALALQAGLGARLEEMAMEEAVYEGPRWSPRRALAVCIGVSLGGWLLIGLAARAAVKL